MTKERPENFDLRIPDFSQEDRHAPPATGKRGIPLQRVPLRYPRPCLMIANVYIDPRLDKGVQLLRRAGKKAALAADRVEEIVSRVCAGQLVPDRAGAVTRHGELRIKGVIKYDLGSGYRLITYRQRLRLYLLYVGSHDDCHRWIENNRELALTIDAIRERCRHVAVPRAPSADTEDAPEETAGTGCEALAPEPEYDQQILREVFAGLCNAGR